MEMVTIIRNNQVKLTVPAEIRNGVLRCGVNILLNSDLVPAGKLDEVKAAVESGRINPEIEGYGIRIGDNGNGLVARWAKDIAAEARAKFEADPALVERAEINKLYIKANTAEYGDYCDFGLACRLRSEAKTRLDAWGKKYPAAAAREKASALRDQAHEKDSLATGALVYDADGWLDAEARQKRHDEIKAEADALRSEAQKIEETINA